MPVSSPTSLIPFRSQRFVSREKPQYLLRNLDNIYSEYFWQPQYDSDVLELVENTCLLCTVGELQGAGPYAGYDYPGAADAVNFSRFKALKDGDTEVTMVFKRPNEDTSIEQQIFKVTVN